MIEVGPGKPVWAFGVMTGTSMDGVDIALMRTDGEDIGKFVATCSYPISSKEQSVIAEAMRLAADTPTEMLKDRDRWPEWLIAADLAISDTIHYGFEQMLFPHGIWMDGATEEPWITIEADWGQTCTGVHGQTIVHRPDEGFTLQIGQRLWKEKGQFGLSFTSAPQRTYAKLGSYIDRNSTEVFDFRHDDLAAGGQGAPLAPFYHFALARHIGATEPIAFLNIGGVANVSWVDPAIRSPEDEGALFAFDTGPGNALINDWMFKRTNLLVMDVDGGAASTGRVHRDRLQSNWARDYLRRSGPKSLDRNDFHGVLSAMEGLSINDGAATLTAVTADCVAASVRHMPSPPTRWLVCGGGRHNQTMMRMLTERLDAPVDPVEAVGLDGDMLEAQAFAYLAVRVLRGLPTSAPSTTGCREPVCGGRISYPR